MTTVLHIGPPKTATTSIQNAIIPRLGRPFQIKPKWLRALAVEPEFHADETFPADAIFSHEVVGWFVAHPAETIARRLATLFTGATVIYMKRNPRDWFYSLYRQQLRNWAQNQAKAVGIYNTVLVPPSADEMFDAQRELHRSAGLGFFAMADVAHVREVFSNHFTLEVLDYELLKTAPDAFVKEFTRACGAEMSLPLTHDNKAEYENIETALRAVPDEVPEHVREKFRVYYLHSRLSAGREAVLTAMQ